MAVLHFWLRIISGIGIINCVYGYIKGWDSCMAKDTKLNSERPVALSGRWMSQRCEIRAGPHFLLRDYEFGYNTSFVLHQYYYADECCTPLYALTIRGVLNEMKKSWVLPGAIDVDYTVTKITVMPYTQKQADLIQTNVLKVCPLARFSAQPWPPLEDQEIFNFELYPTTAHTAEASVSRIDVEFDCLEALNFSFDELHLIRIQRRRWTSPAGSTISRKELLTGETPKAGQMEGERPVSYLSDFLIKAENEHPDCLVCETIKAVTDPTFPPILNISKSPPPFLLSEFAGKWRSLSECESRSSGSFIRRILMLFPDTFEWQGEYQHYTEPECQQRSFTIIGSGTFSLEEQYSIIPSAQKIDFLVMNATVTPHLDFVVQQLATSNISECGIGPWIINRMKDITQTSGCRLLGLTIPNADFNIIRLEKDAFNNSVLHLGQEYQENNGLFVEPFEGAASRPTSFQPALIKCNSKNHNPTTISITAHENNQHQRLHPTTSKHTKHRIQGKNFTSAPDFRTNSRALCTVSPSITQIYLSIFISLSKYLVRSVL